MLETICLGLAVVGLILVILSVLPMVGGYLTYGVQTGVGLIVVGVVLYILLRLFTRSADLSLYALGALFPQG